MERRIEFMKQQEENTIVVNQLTIPDVSDDDIPVDRPFQEVSSLKISLKRSRQNTGRRLKKPKTG